MLSFKLARVALVLAVSVGVLASSTPQMFYGGDLQFSCKKRGEYGPWTFLVDWEAVTHLTGVQGSEVDNISVGVYWEVPLGDEDPAGYGWDYAELSQTTSVGILSGQAGESNMTLPSHAVAEFSHDASVSSLDWYPWAVVWSYAYALCTEW